jgi:hypothetical protein
MQEGLTSREKSSAEPTQSTPAQLAEEEGKKRYYNPGEVMKKKGCIGCGGMVLSVLVLVAALGWALAAL